MIQTITILGVLLTAAVFSIVSQWKHNNALHDQLTTVQGALDDAKAQEKTTADATRIHLKELDWFRKQAAAATRSVANVADDTCADRLLSPGALASLGVQPADRKTPAPAAGRGKGHPDVRR